MADVFVSYANEDRATAANLARALVARGYAVWWDRNIHGGADFAQEIEREITAARVVVVLWSATAVQSNWVRDEAMHARDAGKLVPLRIDATPPPLGFRQLQALDFAAWNGGAQAGEVDELHAALQHYVQPGVQFNAPPITTADATARPRVGMSRRTWSLVAIAAVVVLAAFGAFVATRTPAAPPQTAAAQNGRLEIAPFRALGGDADTRRIADGLPETVVRTLVLNGMDAQTANAGTAAAAAPEFQLKGSVDRLQQTVRISAELLNRASGIVLWSRIDEAPAAESTALQSRFARVIGEVHACALRVRELSHNDPDSKLFAKYLQACEITWGNRGSADEFDRLTEEIVRMRPRSAMAHVWRAIAQAALANQTTSTGSALMDEARRNQARANVLRSVKEARRLEPGGRTLESIGLWAIAFSSDRLQGVAQTMKLYEASLAADPDWGPSRRDYGSYLASVGRTRAARNELARAAALLPLNDNPKIWLARLDAILGNLVESRNQLRDVLARDPGNTFANRIALVFEYLYGDAEAAHSYLDDAQVTTASKPTVHGDGATCMRALVQARLQHARLSLADYDRGCNGLLPFDFAVQAEAHLGFIDRAFQNLDRGDGYFVRYTAEPLFTPATRSLRQDPRFMPFAARIGLVDYWLDSGQWPDFCAEERLPYDCKQAALAARAARPPGGWKLNFDPWAPSTQS